MQPEELLECSVDDLKRIGSSTSSEDLQVIFDNLWGKIRGAKLHAGQARSEQSARMLNLAKIGLQLATHSGKDHFLLEGWKMMYQMLMANEQYEEAAPYSRQVMNRYEELGQLQASARAGLGYMSALYSADHYDEALDVALELERRFKECHDENGAARLATNTANLYFRIDENARAHEQLVLAAETFKKLGDEPSLAFVYLNLGNVLSQLDRFEESHEMYDRCENLCHKLGLPELHIQSSYNHAYLQYLRGRYSDALQSFSNVRHQYEHSGSDYHFALCDLDEAEIYLQLNLSKEAATLATRAAEQFKNLGFTKEQAKATAFVGIALIQMNRFADALETLKAAQEKFEAEGNLYWGGSIDLYRSEVHFSLRRFWESHALASQARKVFDQLAIPSKSILSLSMLARIKLVMGDIDGADAYASEAFAIAGRTKVPLLLFPLYVLRAEVAAERRNPAEAARYYEMAAEDLEMHQARIPHDELRVTFFKGRNQVYESLIRLSLEDTDPAKAVASAYSWCERAKSRGLIELLSHHLPSVHAIADHSLLAKISRLREELNIQYAQSQPEVRPIATVANFETISLKENELARTLREVSLVDPEYASLQQVSIANLDTIRKALPEQATLMEFFFITDEVLAFLIRRDDVKVFRRLCPATRIQHVQERLSFQLEKFLLGEEYIRDHQEQILESTRRHLNELYRSIIGPLAAELKGTQLIVVPHGTLHSLPFHAFYDGEKYLMDNFEISYAPSASVLKYCLEKPDVVGDHPPLLIGLSDENTPFVAHELSLLKETFPNARVFQDEQATCAAFTETSTSAPFIHIATHAIFRQDNPMFSSFKLADGWITALDLFSMKCETSLVTLSGCKSGMNDVTAIDDLVGLMRGFLYAGARSLLLSLWNINDRSTADLMRNFYRNWQGGATRSQALQAAMAAVREEYPNPFYWAPFMLVGKT